MKYKIKFDYKIMDVIGFTLLNVILLILTFGIATPFVILNFIKLVTEGLEIHETSGVSTTSSPAPSWTEIHERPMQPKGGKML